MNKILICFFFVTSAFANAEEQDLLTLSDNLKKYVDAVINDGPSTAFDSLLKTNKDKCDALNEVFKPYLGCPKDVDDHEFLNDFSKESIGYQALIEIRQNSPEFNADIIRLECHGESSGQTIGGITIPPKRRWESRIQGKKELYDAFIQRFNGGPTLSKTALILEQYDKISGQKVGSYLQEMLLVVAYDWIVCLFSLLCLDETEEDRKTTIQDIFPTQTDAAMKILCASRTSATS